MSHRARILAILPRLHSLGHRYIPRESENQELPRLQRTVLFRVILYYTYTGYDITQPRKHKGNINTVSCVP